MFDIRPHSEADPAAVEALLDRAFGPGRQKKTAYRLREGVPPIDELGFAAFVDGVLRGSVQFWPAQVRPPEPEAGPVPIIILGPLAVDPDFAGQGIGYNLMRKGLDRAMALGYRIAILVGDESYYARVGFHRKGAEGLRLPGPVDPARLLIQELAPAASVGVAGMVEKWPEGRKLTSPPTPRSSEGRAT